MPYDEKPIEIETGPQPDAAVIWLHGLGADGHDFVPIVSELQLPAGARWRFIFPHAPHRPVTWNAGYVMRAWYDIVAIDFAARQDEEGLRETEKFVVSLIEREIARGIRPERIVLAGFSQGGASVLHTGLRYPRRLAGILALSTYLPLHDKVPAEAHATSRGLPVFLAHGRSDDIVPWSFGQLTRTALSALGVDLAWHEYDMGHSVTPAEIADIRVWLLQRLRSSFERA